MNDSSDSSFSFRTKRKQQFKFPVPPRKKQRKNKTVEEAILHINSLGLPLISRSSGQPCETIFLEPYKPYTIGRKVKLCDFIFTQKRVSKTHCQLYFDSLEKKIYLSDGLLRGYDGCGDCFSWASTNGTFVNGDKISGVVELRVGDVVRLVCAREEACGFGASVGFSVEKAFFLEEVVDCSLIQFNSRGALLEPTSLRSDCSLEANIRVLSRKCRDILCHGDPVPCKHIVLEKENRMGYSFRKNLKQCKWFLSDISSKPCSSGFQIGSQNQKRVYPRKIEVVENCDNKKPREEVKVISEENKSKCPILISAADVQPANQIEGFVVDTEHEEDAGHNSSSLCLEKLDFPQVRPLLDDKNPGGCGKRFYLNRLRYAGHDIEEVDNVVSLPELFHPIESLKRVFIATFTCNILWFLSCCSIPPHLPVTIACHNAERCWNVDPNKRISVPFSNYPNLTVIYPPFPEVIAFNKDRRNSGIACHHPKLIVLVREDRLRVVVTSANLVENQWHHVTNTVWWQDFPRLSIPNCFSLFTQISVGEINEDSKSDFTAQLARFMATLVTDVPSQAHWILELIKYDFERAAGYLVASVPGIYSLRSSFVYNSKNHLVGNGHKLESSDARFLSSVEASIVGLSHIYRASVDSNGEQLKKLALFLGKCHENMDGMSEIVLRRDTNISADRNAVSVHLPNPEDISMQDFIQLGFLPRNVAQWVAPLLDIGLFAFSAYINPQEVLAIALEGSSNKVKLILYVHMGPTFSNISDLTQPDHLSSICSLISSSQRHLGLWRLKEVLGQYKWPEHVKSDFFFAASSVGSVNSQFLAAFSAAAGKRSAPLFDSEESDPEWGCWTASHELKDPSVRVIFPSIERVKSNRNGIMASRRILCFSQKTWQRLEKLGILHDAVPYPNNRTGFPMHVKVGQRRFQSKDGSSFGWVYCGSHNFSAAAWGRPLSDQRSKGSTDVGNHSTATGSRLHISNYELGIIFIVPPPGGPKEQGGNLDDIVLPFVVPPPKYRWSDRPATPQAMREALTELSEQEQEQERERETTANAGDLTEEEEEDAVEQEEEEGLENGVGCVVEQEKEDEKAYADQLWSKVGDSASQG